jgi:hypothetical protein
MVYASPEHIKTTLYEVFRPKMLDTWVFVHGFSVTLWRARSSSSYVKNKRIPSFIPNQYKG